MRMKKINIIISALMLLFTFIARSEAGPGSSSQPESVADNAGAKAAIFYQAGLSMELNAIGMKTVVETAGVFTRLGRFYPVDCDSTGSAISGSASAGDYTGIARDLGAAICCVVYLERAGDMYLAVLRVSALDGRYKNLETQTTVRSRIINNIPLKVAREVAWLHRDLGLYAPLIGISGGETLIGAGEWHGLKPGSYSTDRGKIDVLKTSRNSSVAACESLGDAGGLAIEIYPAWKEAVHELDEAIDRNVIFASSMTVEQLKGDDPGKRFAKAFCLINNGASLILPGYGSYLACGYLGVKQQVSIANAVLTPLLVFTHFTLAGMMTGFKTNFAPWIRDSDKTAAVQNLQIFCWSTLLTTYAASFLDQLAYQYELTRKLPPFFTHRDQAAAFLSLLVPGGGLFYKGYRIAGWSFYFAEMALAGFGAYSTGDGSDYGYAFGALAIVKAIEIVCAYLIEPSYEVYRLERERRAGRISFSLNVLPDHLGKNVFMASCGMRF